MTGAPGGYVTGGFVIGQYHDEERFRDDPERVQIGAGESARFGEETTAMIRGSGKIYTITFREGGMVYGPAEIVQTDYASVFGEFVSNLLLAGAKACAVFLVVATTLAIAVAINTASAQSGLGVWWTILSWIWAPLLLICGLMISRYLRHQAQISALQAEGRVMLDLAL